MQVRDRISSVDRRGGKCYKTCCWGQATAGYEQQDIRYRFPSWYADCTTLASKTDLLTTTPCICIGELRDVLSRCFLIREMAAGKLHSSHRKPTALRVAENIPSKQHSYNLRLRMGMDRHLLYR